MVKKIMKGTIAAIYPFNRTLVRSVPFSAKARSFTVPSILKPAKPKG